MSKLHVNQIAGYLTTKLQDVVDMADYDHHADPQQVTKAFLTRALSVLAVSSLTDVSPVDPCAVRNGRIEGWRHRPHLL